MLDGGEKVKPTQECADSLPLTCCAVTLAAAVAASAEALLTRPPLPLLRNKHADVVNAEPPNPARVSSAGLGLVGVGAGRQPSALVVLLVYHRIYHA